MNSFRNALFRLLSKTWIYRLYTHLLRANLEYKILRYTQFCASTVKLHAETFTPFRNIHQGQEIVIFACGPSVKDYQEIAGAIKIGINRSIQMPGLDLDYFFLVDGGKAFTREEMHRFNTYRGALCKKFYGNQNDEAGNGELFISLQDGYEANAYRFNVDNFAIRGRRYTFASDLTSQPLTAPGSSVFAAIQFALWTNPKRIYLVGCDCTQAGHFYSTAKNTDLMTDVIIDGYVELKKFAKSRYPETEIVSVNPVGLKGLFRDWYQKDGPLG